MATQLTNGNWVGISVISGIVIACLIGGVGTGIQNLSSGAPYPYAAPTPTPTTPPADISDLAQGDPGSPFAVTPVICATACFGEAAVKLAVLPDSVFGNAGLPFTRPATETLLAIDALQTEHESWRDEGYSPTNCFVTWSELPIVEPEDAPVGVDVIMQVTDQASSDFPQTRLTQAVRLFPDSPSAEAYMTTLYAGLASCDGWTTVSNGVVRPVTLEPKLRKPDSVASFGFVVEPAKGERRYVFDLQVGNMVIRSVAYSDGGIDDQTFRSLMRDQADAMAELLPLS